MNRILLRLSKITELDLYAYFIHVEYRKSTLVKQLLRDFIRKETTVRIRPPHITYDTFTDASMPKVLTISIQLGPQDKDITDYFEDCPNGYRSKCMKSILRIMLAPYTQSAFHREAVEVYIPARQYLDETTDRQSVNPMPMPMQSPYYPMYPYPMPFYGMQLNEGMMPAMSAMFDVTKHSLITGNHSQSGCNSQSGNTAPSENTAMPMIHGTCTAMSAIGNIPNGTLQETPQSLNRDNVQPVPQHPASVPQMTAGTTEKENIPVKEEDTPLPDIPISAPITDNPDTAERESEEMAIPDWGIADVQKTESAESSQDGDADSEAIPDELYKLLTGDEY